MLELASSGSVILSTVLCEDPAHVPDLYRPVHHSCTDLYGVTDLRSDEEKKVYIHDLSYESKDGSAEILYLVVIKSLP